MHSQRSVFKIIILLRRKRRVVSMIRVENFKDNGQGMESQRSRHICPYNMYMYMYLALIEIDYCGFEYDKNKLNCQYNLINDGKKCLVREIHNRFSSCNVYCEAVFTHLYLGIVRRLVYY